MFRSDLTDKEIEEIIWLRMGGESLTSVAEKFHKSPLTIRKVEATWIRQTLEKINDQKI